MRGRARECRHNLVYWRMQEYAGIGPGAHGRLDIEGERHATATEKRPETWLMRVRGEKFAGFVYEMKQAFVNCDRSLLLVQGYKQSFRPITVSRCGGEGEAVI